MEGLGKSSEGTAAPELRLTAAELDAEPGRYREIRRQVTAAARGGRPIKVAIGPGEVLGAEQFAVLVRLSADVAESGSTLAFDGARPDLAAAVERASTMILSEEEARTPNEPLLERVGEEAIRLAHNWTGAGRFVRDALGAILIDPLVGRRWRWTAIVEQMDLIGVRGSAIVVFISLLVGTVLALNGAQQLRQFGATIFIANLVGISMTREMGPLITAVIIAGRSGSAIAAELGSMVVSEEVDALKTMAMDPSRFLIAPRIVALAVMLPCLSVLSDIAGIAGGFLIGVFAMGLGVDNYLRQTAQYLYIGDILTGLSKSIVYAVLIGAISCYEGLQVQGGSQGVGIATTRAVVSSIVAAIVADAIFTLFFYITG